jgi:hypothetical protein
MEISLTIDHSSNPYEIMAGRDADNKKNIFTPRGEGELGERIKEAAER